MCFAAPRVNNSSLTFPPYILLELAAPCPGTSCFVFATMRPSRVNNPSFEIQAYILSCSTHLPHFTASEQFELEMSTYIILELAASCPCIRSFESQDYILIFSTYLLRCTSSGQFELDISTLHYFRISSGCFLFAISSTRDSVPRAKKTVPGISYFRVYIYIYVEKRNHIFVSFLYLYICMWDL